MPTEPAPSLPPPRPARAVFFLGFLTLFLELVLIRYLGGTIWNLGYFPNLVLLGAFVGMGLGFVAHRLLDAERSRRIFARVPIALFLLVIGVWVLRPSVPGFEQWKGSVGGELYFTATPEKARSTALTSALFVVWFGAVIALFAAISQYTAKRFAELPPLKAYSADIAGSCCGIVAFMLLSFGRVSAAYWFLLAAPLFLWSGGLATRRDRALALAALALSAGVVIEQDRRVARHGFHLEARTGADGQERRIEVTWSPYQKVEFSRGVQQNPFIAVNGIGHQALLTGDLIQRGYYPVPHRARAANGALPPYRRVLVLGAGTGNDVFAALSFGAEHVTAVEIDPVIADLGRREHPERPYADPRVRLVVDDGRAVLTRARERFDLIVFALTDSLVKVSPVAQLRLENYLFTVDSLRRAWDLLEDHGTIALYNAYRQPWLLDKLCATARAASGREPTVIPALEGLADFSVILVDRDGPPAAAPAPAAADVEVATDDWPFPYLPRRQLPSLYLATLGAFALVAGGALALLQRRARPSAGAKPGAALRLAFVAMGAAFLLLETKSVIQFSLLFGTTWWNNSLVFLGVLLLVLAANQIAARVRSPRLPWIVAPLLIASALGTLLFPLADLLYLENAAVRFGAAALLTFTPIFFANLLFSAAFRDQPAAELLFGWNLFGAVIGGLFEYASMALGYQALAVAVAVLYAVAVAALASAPRKREGLRPA